MTIDWFTFSAQIVNFLVLVYLLKRFLYGPIIDAIDKRNDSIAEQFSLAKERNLEAEAKRAMVQRELDTLQHDKRLLEDGIRVDVERERAELTAAARVEVDENRQRWQQNLAAEADQLEDVLGQQLAEGVCETTREVLVALANSELEQQLVTTFTERLASTSETELALFVRSIDEEGITVVTSRPLEAELREQLAHRVQELFATSVRLTFVEDEKIICGISLRTRAAVLEWNLADYCGKLIEGIRADTVLDTGQSRSAQMVVAS